MAEQDQQQTPYEILGVARDATEAQIRTAYRKLAKRHHPDLNPGDREAEERFKRISVAYDLLSDPEKRARFDRGEIDASGQERPERSYYRGFAEGAQGRRYGGRAQGQPGGEAGDSFTEAELGDLFGSLFGARGGGGTRMRMRGQDRRYALTVSFLDAVTGATPRLTLPDGRSLDVTLPAGVEDGQVLRLKGQGDPGLNGGPPGDALIEISIAPHRFFRREGRNIHLDLPVTLSEAVLGARVTVPTPTGPVAMTIPPRSDTGTRLRLRGRGVAARGDRPAGDEYVTLKVVVGEPDPALEAFLREHADRPAANPRAAMTEGREA